MGEKEERKERKRRKKILEGAMTKNLPNIMNNINLHVWEAQQIPGVINMKNPYIVTS